MAINCSKCEVEIRDTTMHFGYTDEAGRVVPVCSTCKSFWETEKDLPRLENLAKLYLRKNETDEERRRRESWQEITERQTFQSVSEQGRTFRMHRSLWQPRPDLVCRYGKDRGCNHYHGQYNEREGRWTVILEAFPLFQTSDGEYNFWGICLDCLEEEFRKAGREKDKDKREARINILRTRLFPSYSALELLSQKQEEAKRIEEETKETDEFLDTLANMHGNKLTKPGAGKIRPPKDNTPPVHKT